MKVSKFNLTSDPFYLVDLLKKSESVVSSFIIKKAISRIRKTSENHVLDESAFSSRVTLVTNIVGLFNNHNLPLTFDSTNKKFKI
jgi:hypothetical protein